MGRVVFVGAGPGSADLLTLRGARCLAEAEVVLADALTDPLLRELAPRARWVDVGKRGFCRSAEQGAIDAMLVRLAREHGNVVRLKGGDPSLFGRLEEELAALAAAGIEAEVVPGVTAACAAAAAARRPLTRRGRGRSVALTTAMTREGDLSTPRAGPGRPAPRGGSRCPAEPDQLERAARKADTEVFYMAGRQLAALSRQLVRAGWPSGTRCCVVSRAGCEDERVTEHAVEQLAQATLWHAGRPTVVTVGVGATAVVARAMPLKAEEPQLSA